MDTSLARGIEMNPKLAKGMLTLAFFVLIMALIVLPFQKPGTPEYIPNMIAIILSLSFIFLIIYDVRRQIARSVR